MARLTKLQFLVDDGKVKKSILICSFRIHIYTTTNKFLLSIVNPQ